MAVSRALRRLLRIRQLQEEHSQAALDDALSELRHFEAALRSARERERGGRRLVAAGAVTGNLTDRLAGLEETRAAARRASFLEPRIAEAESTVSERRRQFLERRVERRQAETLIREKETADALEAGRRAQSSIDDWFLRRMQRAPGSSKDDL